MTFYERYKTCCKTAGIYPQSKYAADHLGCARSNIGSLAKYGITPKGDIVAGAAKMLNISANYLLGLIDKPIPLYDSVKYDSLSCEEMEMIKIMRNLNDKGREIAVDVVKGLEMQEKYSHSPIYPTG